MEEGAGLGGIKLYSIKKQKSPSLLRESSKINDSAESKLKDDKLNATFRFVENNLDEALSPLLHLHSRLPMVVKDSKLNSSDQLYAESQTRLLARDGESMQGLL